MNKKELEILLSSLKNFESPNIKLEQYSTPSGIAAEVLWDAYCNGNIVDQKVADLGCGNGILGIGALILGASNCIFLDVDTDILKVAKENLKFVEKKFGKKFKVKFVNSDVVDFDFKVDVIFQNPPFGTKTEHADRVFLEVAVENCSVIYTFHKSSTKRFIEAFFRDNNFEIIKEFKFRFPLKKTFKFQKALSKDIEVTCFLAQRL